MVSWRRLKLLRILLWPLRATPEKLPSPSGRTRRARSRRRVVRAVSSWTYRPELSWGKPGTAWDFHRSVLSALVSRRDRLTPRGSGGNSRDAFSGSCSLVGTARCFSTTRSLAHRTMPNRGPSRSVLAWPLRHRPLPSGAGCVPLRRRVRARTSARVRPRTGRIRPIGVGSVAPFETEPTTPAAHA